MPTRSTRRPSRRWTGSMRRQSPESESAGKTKTGRTPPDRIECAPRRCLCLPNSLAEGGPAVLTEIKTTPAPHPLPRTWLRAIANSITTEFRRTKRETNQPGWIPARALRAWHPTGNPQPKGSRTGSIPRTPLLDNTELLEATPYLHGTIHPNQPLNLPPLAWLITSTTTLTAFAGTTLHEPLNRFCRHNRHDQPFRNARNRHGTPTLRPNEHTPGDERDAITLIAAATTVVVLDEADYWDALQPDFNAELTIRLLERGLTKRPS